MALHSVRGLKVKNRPSRKWLVRFMCLPIESNVGVTSNQAACLRKSSILRPVAGNGKPHR